MTDEENAVISPMLFV